MLVVLSWLLFWIPQDSIPARVSLGSTTVLSIVTFTGSFRNTFPKVFLLFGILLSNSLELFKSISGNKILFLSEKKKDSLIKPPVGDF